MPHAPLPPTEADRRRVARRAVVGVALGLSIGVVEAQGQIPRTVPPRGAAEIVAPISDRYGARGLRRWFTGGGYRDVWGTPIRIPVLDLTAAGGLVPVETGGYGQTVSLEFRGADGLDYAVRSIDKDPTRRLDSLFIGTVVARVVQDQVGQFLPTAALVVDPLLEVTGILHPEHRLVVIPDDERLGQYRERFAGLIGMFTDRPQEGPDDTPGFAGSDRIVNTGNFFDELEEGGCRSVDARGYLKARLMDLVIGDRDRHAGQWRWARYDDGPDCDLWRTIPEDRDQAFVRNDGFMMTLYRMVRPQQVPYGPEYPSVVGLTFNAWEVDRQVLAELDAPDWVAVAEEIQRELTDDVIDDAVRRLPPEHYALAGAFLEESLRARRDRLAQYAIEYYRLISREAEIVGTDRDEIALLEHLPGGDLRVSVTYADGPGSDTPHFSRTYRRATTSEVRLFLHGGDDEARVQGGRGSIEVRVVGGGGDDLFVNESDAPAGDARFYDARGDNRIEGDVRYHDERYRRPPASNLAHLYALDWGGLTRTLPQLGFDPELGVSLGLQIRVQRFGFRKHPTRSEDAFRAAVATDGLTPFVQWTARHRELLLGADLVFDAYYSGLEVLRFHGFGSATTRDRNDDFFKVFQRDLAFSAGLEWAWGEERRRQEDQEVEQRTFRPAVRFGVAPVIEHAETPPEENAGRFISTLDPAPRGLGQFGQVGLRSWFELDSRDSPAYPTSGLRVEAVGAAYPAVWSAREAFGRVEGRVSGYLTPGDSRRLPTLALRVGGSRAFGAFPFHEAAFLGGRQNLRGSREQRFAGEGSVFGHAELRMPLAEFSLLFPTELGVHGISEIGRVFLTDDPTGDDDWHSGFGGGVWFSLLNRSQSFSISLVNGADLLGLYVQGGLYF